MEVPTLYFTESDNYSAPIHPDLIEKLSDKNWKLKSVIGKGNTNTAFLAENNERKAVILIPCAQEYSNDMFNDILNLQKQDKLKNIVEIYDYFTVDSVVDKEDLKSKIEEGIVMYPDYVFDNSSYNILITELLTPLTNIELIDTIINSINDVLIALSNEGYIQSDLHIGNFGISENGDLKVIDLEGICESDGDVNYHDTFIEKLREQIM